MITPVVTLVFPQLRRPWDSLRSLRRDLNRGISDPPSSLIDSRSQWVTTFQLDTDDWRRWDDSRFTYIRFLRSWMGWFRVKVTDWMGSLQVLSFVLRQSTSLNFGHIRRKGITSIWVSPPVPLRSTTKRTQTILQSENDSVFLLIQNERREILKHRNIPSLCISFSL